MDWLEPVISVWFGLCSVVCRGRYLLCAACIACIIMSMLKARYWEIESRQKRMSLLVLLFCYAWNCFWFFSFFSGYIAACAGKDVTLRIDVNTATIDRTSQ